MVQSAVIPNLRPHVKLERQSAAYKIFHHQFIVAIAGMHLYRQEHIECFGRVTSGNAQIDRSIATQDVHVQATIAAMAIHHQEGTTFRLIDPKDSVKIYGILHQHLLDWQKVISEESLMDAPMEDLKAFDALAEEIYKVARYHIANRPWHGQLFDHINTLAARRGGVRRQLHSADPVKNVPAAHQPMAEAMSKEIAKRVKQWR